MTFSTASPERPIQHPFLSIFLLFTSGLLSLHANSITGIKIVCPFQPQTPLPLSLFSLNPVPLTGFRVPHRAELWGITGPERPKQAAAWKNVPTACPSASERWGLINGRGACLH